MDEAIDWMGFYNHRRLHPTLAISVRFSYRLATSFEKKLSFIGNRHIIGRRAK